MWLLCAVFGCLFLIPAVLTCGSHQTHAVTPRPRTTAPSTSKSAAQETASPDSCLSGTLCTRAMCPFKTEYRLHGRTGTYLMEHTCKDEVLHQPCCKVNQSCGERREHTFCEQFTQVITLGDGSPLKINSGCGCVKHRQTSEASKPAGPFVAAPDRRRP